MTNKFDKYTYYESSTVKLKEFDDNNYCDDDEYETPKELFDRLCVKYKIHPELDAAANKDNTKCDRWLEEGLWNDWTLVSSNVDVWCNPPHTLSEEFVRRARQQWERHNINIIMIIPTNTMSSKFWHECIEGTAEYHAIEGRPRFLRYGKPAKFNSRNAYVCVIWRKK